MPWQHHVFPAFVLATPSEADAIYDAIGAVLPCRLEPRAAMRLKIANDLKDAGLGIVIARAAAPVKPRTKACCCRSVRIGKILIQRDEETSQPRLL